ncbi:MAG TPA: thymidine phosphorylase family protein [Burkholderiaceae bacterium]
MSHRLPHPQTPLRHAGAKTMRLKRLGIDTYQEMVAYIRSDCHVCRAEGFESQSRIEVRRGDKTIIATLNVLHFPLVGDEEIGLSEAAWRALGGVDGDLVALSHAAPVKSLSAVRAKIYGRPLSTDAAQSVIADVAKGWYSDIELASLITACSGSRMDVAETVALTQAMVDAGQRLHWDSGIVVDKHCVGGLPGNRTTLIVVPIVAAAGLVIPKTSSRAITSPAGTADTMETLAPVNLGTQQIRSVIEREHGCIAWGGAVNLSPADDVLIRVERPLGLDSDGLMVASILSKKIAAGSTHVVIDMPIGRTAKVRSVEAAETLTARLAAVSSTVGMKLSVRQSDGTQPVGIGIGPALEARDVLAVLQGRPDAPRDLRERALSIAGDILEIGGKAHSGAGFKAAEAILADGTAWRKFQAICDAQGGMREPPVARHRRDIVARHEGTVVAIDNRRLATVAKLAGAPTAAAAGLSFLKPLGSEVRVGDTLYTIHAETPGELEYAGAFADAQEDIVMLERK